jgi:hypothetical protein
MAILVCIKKLLKSGLGERDIQLNTKINNKESKEKRKLRFSIEQ